jgi:hypothetical protein
MEVFIIRAYEFFMKNTTIHSTYGFELTKTKKILLDKWIKFVKDKYGESYQSLGPHFVYEYLLFQINRYYDSDKYLDKDVFGWFFGKKAFDRWIDRHIYWRNGVSKGVMKKFKFYEADVVKYILDDNINRSKNMMKEYEDKFRRDQNWDRCLILTTLYHPGTAACRSCPHKEDCKSTLENVYPIIYKNRIGGNYGI